MLWGEWRTVEDSRSKSAEQQMHQIDFFPKSKNFKVKTDMFFLSIKYTVFTEFTGPQQLLIFDRT